MNTNPLRIIAITAILLLFGHARAGTVTMTVVTNPPNGGSVTGGGTQPSGTDFNLQAKAAPGYYITSIQNSGPIVVAAINFFVQKNDAYAQTPTGGIPDYTIITNDSESWALQTDTTFTVFFSLCSPVFELEPTSQRVFTGTQVTLKGFAYGRQPVYCQWFKDGQPVFGATSSNLVFNSAQPTNSGVYILLTSNVFGATNSLPATLQIDDIRVSLNGLLATNSTIQAVLGDLISLQSMYTNGSIFYTLDGTTPDFGATPYTAAFGVTGSSTLRVIAYSADFSQSVTAGPYSIMVVPAYALHVFSSGGGSVYRDPPTSPYPSNTLVTVSAIPNPGWTFMGWAGALTGGAPTNTLLMNAPQTVQALFGTPLLTTVAGNGAVVRNPDLPLYPFGMSVTLTAVPASGGYFGVWGNAGSGNLNPLTLNVYAATTTVSAVFGTLATNQVTLTTLSDQGGSIGINPSTNRYPIGGSTVLTATPIVNQRFIGWGGDASGSANPLLVTLDRSKVITASFSHDTILEIMSSRPFGFWVDGVLGDVYELQSTTNLMDWRPVLTTTNYGYWLPFFQTNELGSPSCMYRLFVH